MLILRTSGTTTAFYGRLQGIINHYSGLTHHPSVSASDFHLCCYFYLRRIVSRGPSRIRESWSAMPLWRALAINCGDVGLTLQHRIIFLIRIRLSLCSGAAARDARYQIFLTVPVIAFAMFTLQSGAPTAGPIIAVVCAADRRGNQSSRPLLLDRMGRWHDSRHRHRRPPVGLSLCPSHARNDLRQDPRCSAQTSMPCC